MKNGGEQRRENVGTSNRNAGAIPAHRKPKVSLAMEVSQGLGGSNLRSLLRLIRGIESEKNQFSGANSGKIRGARSDAYCKYASERATKKIA